MTFSVENRLIVKQTNIITITLAKHSELMENGYQKTMLERCLRVISKMSSVYNNRRKQGYNYGILDLYRKKPNISKHIIWKPSCGLNQ